MLKTNPVKIVLIIELLKPMIINVITRLIESQLVPIRYLPGRRGNRLSNTTMNLGAARIFK
jgi:hypothetical protein